jgi:prolyl oligopeptidase
VKTGAPKRPIAPALHRYARGVARLAALTAAAAPLIAWAPNPLASGSSAGAATGAAPTLTLAAAAVQPPPSAMPPGAPTAQLRPVAEQYGLEHHGTATLIDNYRWMETPGDPEFTQYLHAQTQAAETMLARIAGRERIRHTIATLQAPTIAIPALIPDGDELYYLKRAPGDDVARLILRQANGGAERVLVDPETLQGVKPHSEITQFAPSQDGTHIAYALAQGTAAQGGLNAGTSSAELHILDSGLKKNLPEHIAGVNFPSIAWRRDSKGFYYTRAEDPAAAMTPGTFSKLGIYLHMLGTDPSTDALILSSTRLPFPFHGAHVIPRLIIPPSSDYAIAVISDGITPELAIYATPVAQLDDQPAPWQSVAGQEDGVIAVSPSYSIAFLLTHDKAPRLRVASEDLAEPGFANARTVMPQGDGVITAIAASSDALFVARREGAGMHLLRLDYNDSVPQDVHLPYAGSIATGSAETPGGLIADARSPGVMFSLQGWTHRQAWMRYDAHQHRVADLGIIPPSAEAAAGYDAVETSAPAADGTAIPLSIIMRHGTAMDHARPTVIEAYGSYGFPFDPRFMPGALAWADEGGVYAIAHVRGGGEFGETWHDAGRFAHKITTITDLLACATALEKAGYTDAAHITAVGTTAGAVATAGAMLRAPGTFRAVALHDGLLNPLRAATYPGGGMAVAEFGAARDPAQFPALLASDAYNQVKDGTDYPAVLFSIGTTASGVPSWQSAKMAARLQAASISGRPILLHQTGNAEADRLTFLLWQTGVPAFQPGAAPLTNAPTKHGKSRRTARH